MIPPHYSNIKNFSVTSQVDLMKLEGVPSVRLHARRDFTSRGSNFFIRWTEVFFLAHSSDLEPSDHMTTASCLAKAISVTLSPFLEKLIKAGMGIVAIRVNLDVEKVSAPGFKILVRVKCNVHHRYLTTPGRAGSHSLRK